MAVNYFSQLGFDQAMNRPFDVAQSVSGLRTQSLNRNLATQQADLQKQQAMAQQKKAESDQARLQLSDATGLIYSALSTGQTQKAAELAQKYESSFKAFDPTFSAQGFVQAIATPEGLKQLQDETLQLTQVLAGPEQMAQFASGQAGLGGAQAIPADIAKYEYWKKMNPNATEAEQREKLNELLVPSERALAVALAAGMGKKQTEQEMIPVEAGKAAAIETAKAGAIAETPLGQAEIEAKQMQAEDARLKAEAAKRERAEKIARSRDMANEALVTVNELLSHPSFSKIVGTIDTLFTVRPDSQDAINLAKRLQSLLTVDNLKLMTGVLTDKDIAFLTGVASGLNVTDDGIKGSESGVKSRLNAIRKKLENNLSKAQDKIDDTQSQATTASDDVVDWSQL